MINWKQDYDNCLVYCDIPSKIYNKSFYRVYVGKVIHSNNAKNEPLFWKVWAVRVQANGNKVEVLPVIEHHAMSDNSPATIGKRLGQAINSILKMDKERASISAIEMRDIEEGFDIAIKIR